MMTWKTAVLADNPAWSQASCADVMEHVRAVAVVRWDVTHRVAHHSVSSEKVEGPDDLVAARVWKGLRALPSAAKIKQSQAV